MIEKMLSATKKARSPILAGVISVVATASPSSAQDEWDYTALIYLWGAGIGGETVTGQDVDVSFSDIVDNLDFGIMGSLEARKGPWAVAGDAIYLNISDDADAAFGPGIPVDADADVKGTVLAASVGYDFIDSGRYRLNGFGGFRYLDMDTTVNVGVGNNSERLRDDFENLDGIIGLRGLYAINDRWDLIYYGDIGTGDTDLTWQAALAADYKFENWALTFGYRYLAWEDLNSSDTLTDVNFSGPFVGAKFSF